VLNEIKKSQAAINWSIGASNHKIKNTHTHKQTKKKKKKKTHATTNVMKKEQKK
jgi:hypothetical protein